MIRKLTCSIMLLVALAACNLNFIGPINASPVAQTVDPQTLINQAVSQTFDAQTQVALAVQQTLAAMVTDTPSIPSDTPSPTITDTPITPSITPSPTITLTATRPTDTPTLTFTFTPPVPMVSVSIETNCRSGPGTAYEKLGVLAVGQSAEVVGRNYSGDTWLIKLPSNPAIICWLWGQYATVIGNTTGLPVATPPPTPTPPITFAVEYSGVINCSSQYAFLFKVTNTGSLTWQSIKLTITDNTTAAVFIHTHDTFRFYNGCILDSEQDDLMPGESGKVANVNPGQLGYNPAGHSFSAVVRVCSENGLAGTCLEKTLSFNP